MKQSSVIEMQQIIISRLTDQESLLRMRLWVVFFLLA